jgi:hypothetical protein
MVRVNAVHCGGVMGHDLAQSRGRRGVGGRDQYIIDDSGAITTYKCGPSNKLGCAGRLVHVLGSYTEAMSRAEVKQGVPGRVRGTKARSRGQRLEMCWDRRV